MNAPPPDAASVDAAAAAHPRSSAPVRRLRADLQIQPRERSGRRQYWLAHPISGRVVRLASQDFRCLQRAAADPRAADAALISEAEAAGLIVGARQPGAGHPSKAWWRNPLYIRLPGFPADRLARVLSAHTAWLFSSRAVGIWSVVIAVVAGALLVNGSRLALALNPLVTFQAAHWGMVLATLATTKTIHELAHAAVCRRMGAAVRDIGVLLLCGTPCLYCDVTDSWRVESRMRRGAIMLAGVYVEGIMAAVAGLVWLTSDDGLLRMAALNLLCVCGVSTVIFNINPLMRYDGYFVLSDLLDVPNLRTRAADVWRWSVVRRLAGPGYQPTGVGASGVGGWGMALYHAASAAYRYVVLAALSGWFYLVLSRAGIEPVGRAAIVCLVVAAGISGTSKLRSVIVGRGGWSGVSRGRRWILGGLGSGLALLAMFLPVERRVTAQGVVQLHAAANVYAPRDGRIEAVACEIGTEVGAGQTLARVDEPKLRIERARLASQIHQLRIRRSSLKRRALTHPEILDQLEEQTAAITATERQLRAVETAIESMTLTAPRGGTVLPAMEDPRGEPSNGLSERLLDRCGQSVQSGSLWCCIGDERRKQVVLEVDASRRRLVETGGLVQIQLAQSPAEIVTCRVADVSAMRHDPSGFADLAPRNRFAVACLLPEGIAGRVQIGATATGVIRGEPLRLWDWCLRRLTGSSF